MNLLAVSKSIVSQSTLQKTLRTRLYATILKLTGGESQQNIPRIRLCTIILKLTEEVNQFLDQANKRHRAFLHATIFKLSGKGIEVLDTKKSHEFLSTNNLLGRHLCTTQNAT